ncbi:MAG TPA: two-component regulator propeller domain-containing protein [Acidobacteriaceae bacterium]
MVSARHADARSVTASKGAGPPRAWHPQRLRFALLSPAGPALARSLRRLLPCLLLAAALPAAALDGDKQLTQYAHSAWRVQDGLFSGSPQVMAQSADGYLWIGTNLGLVRFDGVRFVTWTPPAGERLLDSRIFSLLGARDGSLWIGTGYSISHWVRGHLVNYPQLSGRIESMVEDSQGTLWLARTQATDGMGPVCGLTQERLRCYATADGIPFPNALQITLSDQGRLWISGYSELCRWSPRSSETYFPNLSRRPEGYALFKALTTGPDGSSWAAMDKPLPPLRLEHYQQGAWRSETVPGIPAANADLRALFVDSTLALWVGTARHGVYRVRGRRVDHFDSTDGLSSDAIMRFYQDREGTVWVITAGGIDNFRDVRVTSYSLREGVAAPNVVSVLGAADGTLWVLDNYEALLARRGEQTTVLGAAQGLPGKHVSTLLEDHAGRLWLGINRDLWVYENPASKGAARFRVVRRADGTSLGIVFAIAEDARHAVWVRAGPSLYRIEDFKVQQELTSGQIASAYTLAAIPGAGVVMGQVGGDLVRIRDGRTEVSASDDPPSNRRQIRDLLVEPDGSIWGTTLDELFLWRDGVRRSLTVRDGLPCDGIFALVSDQSRAIWLYSRCGLMRLPREQLEHWWQHPGSKVQVDLLDEFDGVHPGLTSLKPQATRTPDGRLWFANGRVLQMVDPRGARTNALPPPVQIEQVIADRIAYLPADGLRLPALTRDLQIDYTALTFVAPQKVQFRYRLEGHDAGWQDPGSRRQAFYNDLGPGRYRFDVIASNNDGVWNRAGAGLSFAIAPAYYQTVWFRVLLALTAGALLWLLYLLRLRRLTERLQARASARLEERERIARELHDTLLQGFQGLMLRFQAIMTRMPGQDPARQQMGEVLDRADEVLLEGRERVRDLRTPRPPGSELSDELAHCGRELSEETGILFGLQITGTPQPLLPLVSDEAYRIGREALLNAFQHAQPSSIEAELVYEHARFRLRVRDDGKGMDESFLNMGRPGHWGLSGMRERAQALGGQLNIWSNGGAGTEIDLTLSARLAYARSVKQAPWRRSQPGAGDRK